MAIRNILAAGVKIISKQVDDDKADVSRQAWIGDNGSGVDEFAPADTVRCIVSRKTRTVRTSTGQLASIVATLTILDPLPPTTANAGKTRVQPVDPRDIFTLPDGTTAPVVDLGGPFDPVENSTYIITVMLGNVPRGQ